MKNKGAVKQVMIKESEIANKEPSPEPVEFIEFKTKEEREAGRRSNVAYREASDNIHINFARSNKYQPQPSGWSKSNKEAIIR